MSKNDHTTKMRPSQEKNLVPCCTQGKKFIAHCFIPRQRDLVGNQCSTIDPCRPSERGVHGYHGKPSGYHRMG